MSTGVQPVSVRQRSKSKSTLAKPIISILLTEPDRNFEFVVRSGSLIINRINTPVATIAFSDGHDANFITVAQAELPLICREYALSHVSLEEFMTEQFEIESGVSVESYFGRLCQVLKAAEESPIPIASRPLPESVKARGWSQSVICLNYLSLQSSIMSIASFMDRRLSVDLKFGRFKIAEQQDIETYFGYLIEPM